MGSGTFRGFEDASLRGTYARQVGAGRGQRREAKAGGAAEVPAHPGAAVEDEGKRDLGGCDNRKAPYTCI